MRTIEYEGQTFEYDETCLLSYRWQKQLTSDDPTKNFRAAERLFCGKDDEVAERLGDTMEGVALLMKEILSQNGRAAKN